MDFATGRRELSESKLHHYQAYHEFADHIRTVEEEESAKYMVPEGIAAKVWDWLSEYINYIFKLQDMRLSCPLASVNRFLYVMCVRILLLFSRFDTL